ncbi:hypothetical protein PBCVNEJV1_869R [Paramecium bursaria Chlorella virus NE-JV-1]|nr:hypothetical protein PBCVNEJV1_869R [Paramecium bursaria Chlorella virus NE-JV-1]
MAKETDEYREANKKNFLAIKNFFAKYFCIISKFPSIVQA